MYTASCLCGAFQFEITGELKAPRFCHCQNCTKFAGVAPAAWAMATKAQVRCTVEGDSGRYNSGGGIRCFCKDCGSPLWFESLQHPEIVAIPLGVIDSGGVPAPQMRIFTRSNPAWCHISDDLPRFEDYPPS